MMPSGGDMSKDRKVEQKVDMKKKTQAEIEQEMAALQYTNPMLLEVSSYYAVSIAAILCLHCILMEFPVLGTANEDGPDSPN